MSSEFETLTPNTLDAVCGGWNPEVDPKSLLAKYNDSARKWLGSHCGLTSAQIDALEAG